MDKSITESTFTVPLGVSVHRLAEAHCQQVANPHYAKQIYLNTLAVYAVQFYCRCMGIELDRDSHQQYNLIQQVLMPVADLSIPKCGRLECCPVLPGDTTLAIAPEAWDDRIGYVAVQFEPSLKQATILGYVPQMQEGDLPLNELRSLDELMRDLQQRQTAIQPSSEVNLGQWLHNQFEAGWQAIEDVLRSESSLTFAYRSELQSQPETVRRAKLVNLNVQLVEQVIVLLVAITPEADQKVRISVQVHPLGENPYLPSDLSIRLLSEVGEELQQVRSRSHDNYIQLPRFRGVPQERFQLQLSCNGVSVTEFFTL
ncbi:MAG: DUF1822 family protein [Leptolyngbyaceae cyanobacterium bins.349]|nr:DUF1822 family protein [Leptolyngbyaceae cyanobacterium bins.349]